MTMNDPMKIWNLRRSPEGRDFLDRIDNCTQAVDLAYFDYQTKLASLRKLEDEFKEFLGVKDEAKA